MILADGFLDQASQLLFVFALDVDESRSECRIAGKPFDAAQLVEIGDPAVADRFRQKR
jgi:hypothetical protein